MASSHAWTRSLDLLQGLVARTSALVYADHNRYMKIYNFCTLYVFILAEITQFQTDGTLKRFTHGNGRLIVTRRGSYYIYAQAFFESYTQGDFLHNRVALTINGNEVSLIQTPLGEGRTDYGSHFTGVVKFLKKGDYISLKTVYPSRLWVSYAHTFFGAHKI